MIRASTTPSMPATSRWIASAISRACARFLPEMRTLIGDDLPSFMRRADHAAGVEGELQVGELRVGGEAGAEQVRRTPGPSAAARA